MGGLSGFTSHLQSLFWGDHQSSILTHIFRSQSLITIFITFIQHSIHSFSPLSSIIVSSSSPNSENHHYHQHFYLDPHDSQFIVFTPSHSLISHNREVRRGRRDKKWYKEKSAEDYIIVLRIFSSDIAPVSSCLFVLFLQFLVIRW